MKDIRSIIRNTIFYIFFVAERAHTQITGERRGGEQGVSYRSALAAEGAIDKGRAEGGHAESKSESPERCQCNDQTLVRESREQQLDWIRIQARVNEHTAVRLR